VHGEPVALNALQAKIKERTPNWNVTIPNYMQSFDLQG
jgi:hypothetical protein